MILYSYIYYTRKNRRSSRLMWEVFKRQTLNTGSYRCRYSVTVWDTVLDWLFSFGHSVTWCYPALTSNIRFTQYWSVAFIPHDGQKRCSWWPQGTQDLVHVVQSILHMQLNFNRIHMFIIKEILTYNFVRISACHVAVVGQINVIIQ